MPRNTEEEREQFESALAALTGEEPLSTEQLDSLTVLEGPDLERVREVVWDRLPAAARARLLQRLKSAAEQRLRLDFSNVNYIGLADPDPEVRLAAIRAGLDDLSRTLLSKLIDLSSHDPDPRVRKAAAEDLGRFALAAERNDLDPREAQRVTDHLTALLEAVDEDPTLASEALAGLGYFANENVSEALARFFTDRRLRQAAIRGMGNSADPRWTDRLLPTLGSEDPEIRLAAIRALKEIEDERAAVAIAELIDDTEEDIQIAAIDALGILGGEQARDALLYALKAPSDQVREAAENALSELEAEEGDDLGL